MTPLSRSVTSNMEPFPHRRRRQIKKKSLKKALPASTGGVIVLQIMTCSRLFLFVANVR